MNEESISYDYFSKTPSLQHRNFFLVIPYSRPPVRTCRWTQTEFDSAGKPLIVKFVCDGKIISYTREGWKRIFMFDNREQAIHCGSNYVSH